MMLNYMDVPDYVILVVSVISILLAISCVKIYATYCSVVYFLHCRIWPYIASPFDESFTGSGICVERVGGIDIWICNSW